jgi:hypothetical protein
MRRPFHVPAYNAKSTKEAPNPECKDPQCVEEECDPEECGNEKRGPSDENKICGVDKRPLLPLALSSSTLGSLVFIVLMEFPVMSRAFDYAESVKIALLGVHGITLGCMAYCALFDPGQLPNDHGKKATAALMGTQSDSAEDNLPARAHKTWMYKQPIRRYDHYCRWLTNCIGLFNHREFVMMVCGLVAISFSCFIVNVVMVFKLVKQESYTDDIVLLAGLGLHTLYLLALFHFATPIMRLHIGFVCRNELAHEWKRNDFYVVQSKSCEPGEKVSVNELSDNEYNDRFDMFEYDKSKNRFDNGCLTNCATFWCTSRWSSQQLGDF